MERMTASSSACEPMLEKMSETGMPDWPYFLNCQGLGMMLPLLLNWVRSTGTGMGLPASLVSLGLGSKESTCETPPDM